jgi:glutamine amidotransferase
MRVTIFDYGAGNIHSLSKALAAAGAAVCVEPDPVRAIATDLLVLPGVGAFGRAAHAIASGRDAMRNAILAGLPTLGVCLGMQLLFESSEEGNGIGLGVFEGRVTRLESTRTPQIGWNTVDDATDAALRAASLGTAYYANGFACRPVDLGIATAWSTHEHDRFPAVVRRGATVGVQFHPEKSSQAGLAFVAALLEEARP